MSAKQQSITRMGAALLALADLACAILLPAHWILRGCILVMGIPFALYAILGPRTPRGPHVMWTCDFCEKPPTVFLTQIVDEKMSQVNLCAACAKERGAMEPTGFQLADFLPPEPKEKKMEDDPR